MWLERSKLLFGEENMAALQGANVLVVGLGGVGAYAAEMLVRSGIGKMTIADSDCVGESNINRQLIALHSTIGRPKSEVLAERLLDINPKLDLRVVNDYIKDEKTDLLLDSEVFDYVIDAIDSLKDKAHLILEASKSGAKLFASMGAALKLDPTKVRVAEFWDVKGCPLGAALRKKFKKDKTYPKRKFKCVYSEELLENKGEAPEVDGNSTWDVKKAQINGSLVHITAIFGFTLSGLVVQDVENAIKNKDK